MSDTFCKCGKALRKNQIRQGGKYCSASCCNKFTGRIQGDKLIERNHKEYESSPVHCKSCGNKLPYSKRHNKFCDHSCAAAYNNKGVRRHGASPGNCLRCGDKVKGSYNKFCSSKCFHSDKHEKYIERWLKGEEKGCTCGKNSGEELSLHIRRWLFEERGKKCELCGWEEINPTTGKVPVQINHIDGDSRHCRPDNLEVICPNCHSLTSTFGSLNKGNGRKGRYDSRSI